MFFKNAGGYLNNNTALKFAQPYRQKQDKIQKLHRPNRKETTKTSANDKPTPFGRIKSKHWTF